MPPRGFLGKCSPQSHLHPFRSGGHIPRGGEGRFDSVWLNLPTNPPIVNYHQLWFYYSGRAGGPGAQFPAPGRLPFRRLQPDHPQHAHLRGTALLVDARPRQAVRASGHWQEGRSARRLAGKRIRLFFKIQDAHLYSFRASSS